MGNPESLHLGGPLAIGLFILSLIAFVAETQLTQVGSIIATNLSHLQLTGSPVCSN